MSTSNTLFKSRRALAGAAFLAASLAVVVPTTALRAEPAPANTTPPATDVSGVLVPETPETASPARGLLVVPRAAVTAVAYPLRGGLTLYERHHVREHLVDFFFDDTRTYGLYPALSLETRTLPGVGARFVHRDLFDTGAKLRLAGDYGGESRYKLEGGLSSAPLADGLLTVRLGGGWQAQPSAPFFGIGDQDLVRPDPSVQNLPGRSPVAVSTTFRQEVLRAELGVGVDPAGPIFAAVTTAYFQRSFGDTTVSDPSLPPDLGRTDQRFDTSTLTGWGQGTKVSYSELQLGWNSLRVTGGFVPAGAPSTGAKVVAFGGLARGLDGSPVAYARYGLDAFRYFDLYGGDRVLIVRGRLEGVEGADDQIPFTDLPRLGGTTLLRGYDRERFRDRVALLGSVEYRYPIWRQLGGFLFVDGGRVLPGLADLGSAATAPQHLRPGFGGGLEVLQGERFRMRGQVAGSSEGFFFQLSLDPVYRLPTHNYRI